ncbi:MAG TPA: tetratricopeptide repeat protein, partial [Gammaproteobacteria bacterium]|nr:tetratricopeptide repeat protein [Gammaproteobacteria bacterium]
RQGDTLARQLWQQMVKNGISHKQLDKMVKRGNDEIYLSMYWEDPGDTNAIKWLCRSADKENTKAQFRLGLLYEMGSEDVPKDPVKAYMWYRLAASRGDYMMASEQVRRLHEKQTTEQLSHAEYLIQEWSPGQCEQELLHDIPLYPNDNQSAHLFLKDIDLLCPEAELGKADAQTQIGDLYYVGSYGLLDKDQIQAYVWYSLGSKNGNSYAASLVEKVRSELTPEQYLKAKDRLEKWEPGRCRMDLLTAASIISE